MEFLYPKFDKITHEIINSNNISIDYPFSKNFNSKKDLNLPIGLKVSVVEENLGFECQWHKVKIIDNSFSSASYFNSFIYILKENLKNIGNKKTFKPFCKDDNLIDVNAPEIDPKLRQIFLPYVDSRNGFLSVRIQTDYEKILDAFAFENLLNEVYYEGVNVLLSSRGFKSDNETIKQLTKDYYSFAYINKDLDLTVERRCEPLTFTVSIPLRFFNNFVKNPSEAIPNIGNATKFLKINNLDFLTNISRLTRFIGARSAEVQELIMPDKFIDGFVIDFELSSIRSFGVSFIKMMALAGFPLKNSSLTEYEFGFDNDLNLVFVKILDGNNTEFLNNSILAQMRLNGEFNSKRIFNYLLNLNNIENDLFSITILEFLDRYVNYPKANLETVKIVINEQILPPETVRQYTQKHEEAKHDVIKLSDVTNLAQNAISLTDTVYTLFVEERSKKELKTSWTSFKENFEIIEDGFGNNLNQQTDDEIGTQFLDGFSQTGDQLKKQFKKNFNLSTLMYVLRKINFKKALFQHVFCYLKGINPQRPDLIAEVADLVSRIPPEIINYFNYLYTIRSYKGASFARAAMNGFPFDPVIFSTKNDSIIYFVKGLTKIVQTLNVIGVNVLNTINSLANIERSKNPFAEITVQLLISLEQALIKEVLNIVKEALVTSCEDDLLIDPINYPDPYRTIKPQIGFQNSSNDNSDRLNKNRDNALTDVYNPLIFGFDKEYTVNLLDSLLTDINCILTPIESVNLLKGKPTELMITLVKNIIRNKYSAAPNDLSFLLTDNEKLKLFFKRLGLTVDEDVLNNIEKTIVESNRVSKTNLCSPELELIREEILNNKIPPELGVLNDQLIKRAKKARKLFEYIQKGETSIDVSSLCPEIDNKEIAIVKDNLIKNYIKTINNTFSNVLTNFNDDVTGLYSKISEKRNLIRRNNDGKLIDSIEFETFYKEMNYNINLFSLYNIEEINSTNIKTKLGYINRDYEQIEEASKNEGLITAPSSLLFCPATDDAIKTLDQFFAEGNCIYIEWYRTDAFFDDIDDDIGNDMNEKRNEKTPLTQELLTKDYIFSIGCNADATGADEIEFNFYKNDRANDVWVGTRSTIEGDFTGLRQADSENWTSEEFYDESENIIIKNLKKKDIEEEYRTLFQSLKDIFGDNTENVIAGLTGAASGAAAVSFISLVSGGAPGLALALAPFTGGILAIVTATAILGGLASIFTYGFSELTRPKVYRITKEVFDQLNPNLKSAIITQFLSWVLPNIERIKKQKEDLGNLKNIVGGELFYQTTDLNKSNGQIKNEIFLKAFDNNLNAQFFPYLQIDSKINFEKFSKSLEVINASQNFIFNSLPSDINTRFYRDDNSKSFYRSFNWNINEYARIKMENNGFLKSFYDPLKDFVFTKINSDNTEEKISPPISDNQSAEEFIKKKDIKVIKNANTSDQQRRYFTYNLFYRTQDRRMKVCNINPHYLNLDFFRQSAVTNLAAAICDTNLRDHPFNSLKEILVNLTFRTYVTDLLIKSMPLLSVFTKEQLNELYKSDYVVEILLQFMKKDMELIAPNNISNSKENKYFFKFNEYTNQVYETYLENGIKNSMLEGNNYIVKRFNDNLDCNDKNYKLKYFIKKEIYHFIKFSINNRILTPSEKSLFDSFYEERTQVLSPQAENFVRNEKVLQESLIPIKGYLALAPEEVLSVTKFLFFSDLLKDYFETQVFSLMPYVLMSNTIDISKRILFYSTKYELYDILAQIETSDDENEDNIFDTENDEDVYDEQNNILAFVDKLSKSPAPAALAVLNPKYIKYASYYIKAAFKTTLNVVGSVAENSDFNIALTSRIDSITALASSAGWSILDEQTRSNLIANTENVGLLLIYRRLEDGRVPIPFSKQITSALVFGITAIPPLGIGKAFLVLDAIEEGLYMYDLIQKIQQERGISQDDGILKDPCAPEVEVQITKTATFVCTPENKVELINEVNKNEYQITKNIDARRREFLKDEIENIRKCPVVANFVLANAVAIAVPSIFNNLNLQNKSI